MAIIPSSTQFVGISPNVNLEEKKSNRLNSETQPYTMQDFQDSISPDLSPIVVDGNSVGIDADPTATTQAVAVIESLTTNAGIVLKPNGTGAIMAQVPDGTVTGGNARGQYAVDLQRGRTNSTQVAGGRFDVIAGGENNFISIHNDGHRFIGSGYQNAITIAGSSVIAGGSQNSISGPPSAFSTISGGQSNTASTNTHATVVGGQSNTSSGQYSVSGGNTCTASGASSVAIGSNNITSNTGAVALGSYNNTSGNNAACIGTANLASQTYAVSLGFASKGYLRGQLISASGYFNGAGDAQQSILVARKSDTLASAATTVLSLDGTGTTNLIIPDGTNRAWNVTVKWVAVCTATGSGTTAVGDVAIATDSFMFKKVSGTSSIGSVQNLQNSQDATMAGATCSYAVGGSQDLQITFTAPASANATTFRVVAKVELTEVAW